MRLYELTDRGCLEKWMLDFLPATITLCRLEDGEEIQETSLAAARLTADAGSHGKTVPSYLSAGKAAMAYGSASDTVVFSPLRQGQVANYDGTVYLFRAFLRRLRPGFRLPKPVLCIRMQERTTEVERIALIDAGIQAGAGKVLLYQESLPALREYASQRKELRHALVFHIEVRGKE